jgi:tRNA A-37 threonylcarbamoyl transferase component Bud32
MDRRWQRVEALLDAVLDLPAAERRAFLVAECGDDSDLREQVERLARACDAAEGFLETPLGVFAAPLISDAGDGASALTPGTRIAHYALLECVGAGGMGVVYKARDLKLGRLVALKFLPDSHSRDELARARLTAEARAIAALDHPNIAVVHEIAETAEGREYIALAWYDGITLKALLERGALPPAEAVRVAAQIAAALAAAHAAGVVHRDVKPSNILLLHAGGVKLLDFGIAKQAGVELTRDGSTLGTVAYMSPEQARGDPVDERTDLWSLGVVLYEMLTGQRPFRGETSDAVLYAIRYDDPQPAASLRSEVSDTLDAIVASCLVRDTVGRCGSAAGLFDQLVTLEPDLFSSTELGRLRSAQAGAPSRRSPVLPRWVPAASVLIVAVAVASFARYAGAPRTAAPAYDPRRVLITPLENRTGVQDLDVLGRMAADWIIHGLADTRLVDVVPLERVLSAATPAADEAGANPLYRAAGLANRTGAGIVVRGAYYQQGDSLYFRASVTDGRSDRLLHSLESPAAAAAAPLSGIEQLRLRIMSALAPSLFPMHDYATVVRTPPRFEAYRAFMRGVELFIAREFAQAIPQFAEAAAADPDFTLPLIHLGAALSLLGHHAALDSLLRTIRPRLAGLTEAERLGYDILDARVKGDLERFYRLSLRAPESSLGTALPWRVANAALWVNRPAELISRMRVLDPEQGKLRGWRLDWISLAQAHHLLGDHRAELRVAQKAEELFPGDTLVSRLAVHALAGLRRTRELRKLIDELGEGPPNPAVMLRHAGLELIAHGASSHGKRLLAESLEWQRARPLVGPAAELFLAESYMLVGELDEAERLLIILENRQPGSIFVRGIAGTLAARRGDRARAMELSDWLAALDVPYHRYRTTYRRARIAAQLGDLGDALQLLRQAYSEGALFWAELHADPDLAPLWDYEPFREFLRPRG